MIAAILLILLALGTGAFGGLILIEAKTVIHQIAALVLFLIASVFLTGGLLAELFNNRLNQVREALADLHVKRIWTVQSTGNAK